MITLEDLYVATQAKRYSLVETEQLRALLAELARSPERLPLVRALHERLSMPMDKARGLHNMAQRYLRQRGEERYRALLQREGFPPDQLTALAQEQATAGFSWLLGERLVREGRLQPNQHQDLLSRTRGELQQEDAQLVAKNTQRRFAPVLGPPPDASNQDARISGRLPTYSEQDLNAPTGPGRGGSPGVYGEGQEDNLQTMMLKPGQASSDDEDDELSFDIALPGQSPGPVNVGASGVIPGLAGPGATNPAGSGVINPGIRPAPGALDPSKLAPGAPVSGGLSGDDSERTITLPAGVASGLKPPAPQGGPPPGDPFGTMQMDVGNLGAPGQADPAPPQPADPGPGMVQGGSQPGHTIAGRYQVARELGRGAMGIVYLAQDPQRGEVALKLMQGPVTEEVRGRFEREIAVSQRITHPHVIEVFDHGDLPDQSSYMVMEVLEGDSLKGILVREGAQDIERSLRLLEQLLEGLTAVHGASIVHRDLKPENLQVLERMGSDHVKIVDFGISRFLDGDEGEAEQFFQTMRGKLSGTPQYVAPEAVLEPDLIKTSHDVYACGVILYELLTGQLPFPPSRSLRDMLSDTVNSRARPLDEANPAAAPFPKPIERLVRRLLEKDPELRPADAAAALELLREIRSDLQGGGGGGQAKSESFTTRLIRSITGLFKRDKIEEN